MSGTAYDPAYCNGPCQEFYLHHLWHWNGARWECERCEKLAHTQRFSILPCVACGRAIESVYETRFCGPCLDACLDLDDDYVPFSESKDSTGEEVR